MLRALHIMQFDVLLLVWKLQGAFSEGAFFLVVRQLTVYG